MAHFAELNENNIVLRVTKVHNDVLLDENGNESEALGLNHLEHLGGRWVQTSYNKTFRKNYAAIGMFYDEIRDAFYWQESDVFDFVFDEETCTWIPPIPLPQDNKLYNWDYINSSWVELILPEQCIL